MTAAHYVVRPDPNDGLPPPRELCRVRDCQETEDHDESGNPSPLLYPDRADNPGSPTQPALSGPQRPPEAISASVSSPSEAPEAYGAAGGSGADLRRRIRQCLAVTDAEWDDETGDGPLSPPYLDRLADAVTELAGRLPRVIYGIPEGPWRQGSHAPRNLWIEDGSGPDGRGRDVGRMDTPDLAALVVDAVNLCGHLEAEVRQLRADLKVMTEDACRLMPDLRRWGSAADTVIEHATEAEAREQSPNAEVVHRWPDGPFLTDSGGVWIGDPAMALGQSQAWEATQAKDRAQREVVTLRDELSEALAEVKRLRGLQLRSVDEADEQAW